MAVLLMHEISERRPPPGANQFFVRFGLANRLWEATLSAILDNK